MSYCSALFKQLKKSHAEDSHVMYDLPDNVSVCAPGILTLKPAMQKLKIDKDSLIFLLVQFSSRLALQHCLAWFSAS